MGICLAASPAAHLTSSGDLLPKRKAKHQQTELRNVNSFTRKLQIFLHEYIRHIRDISQLCTWAIDVEFTELNAIWKVALSNAKGSHPS